jgi:hypothetical protein
VAEEALGVKRKKRKYRQLKRQNDLYQTIISWLIMAIAAAFLVGHILGSAH